MDLQYLNGVFNALSTPICKYWWSLVSETIGCIRPVGWSVAESTGGVAPFGWVSPATILIDEALNDYDVLWAAAGHPHAVFPTSFDELVRITGAQPMIVAED